MLLTLRLARERSKRTGRIAVMRRMPPAGQWQSPCEERRTTWLRVIEDQDEDEQAKEREDEVPRDRVDQTGATITA